MKKVKISIIGESKTGKAILIFLIRNYLRSLGFEVGIDPTPDYRSEEQMSYYVHRNFDKKISAIKEKVKINMNGVQIFEPNELKGGQIK